MSTAGSTTEGYKYTREEVTALKSLFDSCDRDRTGRIHINQLPGLLSKLGKGEDEIINVTEVSSKMAEVQEGTLTFNNIISVLEKLETKSSTVFEGPDPKVIEFLRILEEYRIKCEEEGNYLEAGRAHKQLAILRKQEEKRQQKAIRARQISERQDVQLAHNMQFSDFNAAWDKYMDEYDNMAQMYIQQMTERHAVVLLEFQKKLRQELASKPPKWSRELLDQRRKQHIHARNKNYVEAQKLKKICDRIEDREREEMEQEQAVIFARKEAKFRAHQQSELQALLKRIECRRKEHIKQRNLDSKRLLQRNRNVQAVLESKQNFESQRLFDTIKKALQQNSITSAMGSGAAGAGAGAASSSGAGGGNSNNRTASASRGGTGYGHSQGQEQGEYYTATDYSNAMNNDWQQQQQQIEGGFTYQQLNPDTDFEDAAFLKEPGPTFGSGNYNEEEEEEE